MDQSIYVYIFILIKLILLLTFWLSIRKLLMQVATITEKQMYHEILGAIAGYAMSGGVL